MLFSFTSRLLFPSSFSWICSVSFFDILDILVYLIGLLHDRNFSSTCSFYLFQLPLSLSLLSLPYLSITLSYLQYIATTKRANIIKGRWEFNKPRWIAYHGLAGAWKIEGEGVSEMIDPNAEAELFTRLIMQTVMEVVVMALSCAIRWSLGLWQVAEDPWTDFFGIPPFFVLLMVGCLL